MALLIELSECIVLYSLAHSVHKSYLEPSCLSSQAGALCNFAILVCEVVEVYLYLEKEKTRRLYPIYTSLLRIFENAL